MKIEKVQIVGASIRGLSIPSNADVNRPNSLRAQSGLAWATGNSFRPVPTPSSVSQSGTSSFNIVVPYGVDTIRYDLRGAGGGGGGAGWRNLSPGSSRDYNGGRGGNGAKYVGNLPVEEGDIIQVVVGTGGARGENRPSQGSSGSNGGSSRIYLNSALVVEALGGTGGGGGKESSSSGTPGTNQLPTGGSLGGNYGYDSTQPTKGENGSANLYSL